MPTLGSALGSRLKRWWSPATVSTWTDNQFVSDATQGTAARQPVMGTHSASGNRTVSWSPDGSFTTNADVMTAAAAGPSTAFANTIMGGTINVASGYAFSGAYAVIFGITSQCSILINTANNLLVASNADGSATGYSDAVINDGATHTWTATFTASGAVRLWIDGVQQVGTSGTYGATGPNLGTAAVLIGSSDASGSFPFQGITSQFFIAQDTAAFTSTDQANIHAALLEYINGTKFTRPKRPMQGPARLVLVQRPSFESPAAGGPTAVPATATFAGTSSLAATGLIGKAASGTVAGTSILAAAGLIGRVAQVVMSSIMAMSFAARVGLAWALSFVATSSAAVTALLGRMGLWAVPTAGTMAASGTVVTVEAIPASCTFACTSSMAVAGKVGVAATATFAATSSMAATGTVEEGTPVEGSASFGGTISIRIGLGL